MQNSVLIVDDHPMFRNGVRDVVDAEDDFSVVSEACNAEQAVSSALRLRPRFVILDMSMPGCSGAEAARRIKQQAPEIGILILSMHTERRYVLAALRAGADAYLLKDSARNELVDALRSVLGGGHFYSDAIKSIVASAARSSARDDGKDPMETLTERERQVLVGIASGASTKSISRTLDISPKTVATHREHLLRKTQCHNAVELARLAFESGLLSPAE